MSNNEHERDKVRLLHILGEIAEIEHILELGSKTQPLESALERKYTIIGEACRAMSQNLRNKYIQKFLGLIL